MAVSFTDIHKMIQILQKEVKNLSNRLECQQDRIIKFEQKEQKEKEVKKDVNEKKSISLATEKFFKKRNRSKYTD